MRLDDACYEKCGESYAKYRVFIQPKFNVWIQILSQRRRKGEEDRVADQAADQVKTQRLPLPLPRQVFNAQIQLLRIVRNSLMFVCTAPLTMNPVLNSRETGH